MKRYLAILLAANAALAVAAQTTLPSAEDIMKRVDANAAFASIEYEGRMEITIGGKTRVKTMKAYAVGKDKAFAEFSNPEDKGVRFLKLDKDLWMYFPKEQDTVKISGHMLKEGMMGSDVSYEDALESDALFDYYAGTTKGEGEVDGRRCYVVELVAKNPKASYDRRLVYVDAERYVTLRAELYAKSGKMLKESRTLEVRNLDGRWFATKVEMVNKLRKDTKTVMILGALVLDKPIDQKRFTMAALTK